jgi:hypothetical protein
MKAAYLEKGEAALKIIGQPNRGLSFIVSGKPTVSSVGSYAGLSGLKLQLENRAPARPLGYEA